MMQPNDLPLVCLPTHLSDEAAAQLLGLDPLLWTLHCAQLEGLVCRSLNPNLP